MQSFLFIFASLVVTANCQYTRAVDPKNAAILQEARYLSGDGSFGSAYATEDGNEFKEETDADGTRKGQYSYIDPTGMKITVHYTAGKNGFQVTGDHLPKPVQPIHPQQPQQPQYQAPKRQQQYQPQPAPQYNANPQYNSIPNQQQSNGQFSYSFGDGQQQYNNGQNYNNNNNNRFNQFSNNNNFQNYQNQPFQTTTTTTPSPRFFPSGKLNLNRTPDGYQYSFSAN